MDVKSRRQDRELGTAAVAAAEEEEEDPIEEETLITGAIATMPLSSHACNQKKNPKRE